jgi:protein TonB
MFAQPPSSQRCWHASLLVSFVVHCVAVYFLVRPPRPIFVTPSQLAFGHGGTSTELVFFSQRGSSASQVSTAMPEKRQLALCRARARRKPSPKPAALDPVNAPPAAESARAGSPYGSLAHGPTSGHDVRPALPIVFPDPAILPWQIPSGIEGNVIVEVTIDAQGNVTETRVLQGLGHGIEEKCVAAVRSWRFRPAMMDGRPIPSQQDVYFHFPS